MKERARFPVVESLASASAMTGAPAELIKAARRKGCKAFLTHGRIDLGLLVPFLFELLKTGDNGLPDGFASWKEVLDAERAKRERIKREQDEKSLMLISDARRQAAEAQSTDYDHDKRMSTELPPELAGMPAVEIHKRLKAWIETKWQTVREKYDAIGT